MYSIFFKSKIIGLWICIILGIAFTCILVEQFCEGQLQHSSSIEESF